MSLKFYSTLVAATTAIISLSAPVQAFTLNLNNSGQVESIDELNVEGVLYDVTFNSGSFFTLFDETLPPGTVGNDGRMGPTFWEDFSGALAAAEAISAALGSSLSIAESSSQTDSDAFYVPYSFETISGSLFVNRAVEEEPLLSEDIITGEGGVAPSAEVGSSGRITIVSYAKFSLSTIEPPQPTSVPEPVFATSLLGFGAAALAKRKLAPSKNA